MNLKVKDEDHEHKRMTGPRKSKDATARDTVLVVGASGSLGAPIVAELLRRGHKIRLLGRSEESFARAGYDHGVEVAIVKDVADPTKFLDGWFADVTCVVCVARPRSLKEGDALNYRPMVENLCRAALRAGVPRLLLHGLPYFKGNAAGESPTMRIVRETESMARKMFDDSVGEGNRHLHLTISRICEMSEIGHLLESARIIGFFPSAAGYNTLLHPISPRDFGIAVANFVEDEEFTKRELLVGGPWQIRWRELGELATEASGGRLRTYTFPFFIYNILLQVLGLFPSLRGLYICLKLVMIPMVTNTASKDFMFVGSDGIEEYIKNQMEMEGTSWVHSKVFGGKGKTKGFFPPTTNLAFFVGLIAACDAVVAFFKPSFIGHMQNLDVKRDTFNRHLIEGFGIAASSIAVKTILSASGSEGKERMSARHAVGAGMATQVFLSSYFWAKNVYVSEVTMSSNIYLLFGYLLCNLVLTTMAFSNSKYWGEVALLSGLVFFLVDVAHFLHPDLIQYSLGIEVGGLDDKTLQHVRQASMYYIASAAQTMSLSLGVEPERAAGTVSLVWCLCSSYLWFVVKIYTVFEMSPVSYHVNLTFPIWSGLLATGILCR